ncbi:MAG: molybdopterin-dependent oxidoreductase, partial [Chloroflexi bacterium]|nr:molybdopterin-dependent oxidoreductase [Chloroflexota bacterium]
AAGLAGWGAMAWLARSRETPGARRTVTGSREQGSFAGNSFPVTNGYGEGRTPVDAAAWTFSLVGAVEKPIYLSYAAFLARPAREFAATLDCTTGWYSSQVWTGVPLAELLDEVGLAPSANAIRLIAATGYAAEYPLDEAQTLFLATHVGGEVLDRWHGFPLRVVAPTRRGWQWVKWLTAVEVRAGPGAVAPARFNNLAFAADPLSATRFGLAHVPPLNSRL